MYLLHRIALPFLNATVITLALFYLMYSLVRMDDPQLLPVQVLENIQWAQVPEDSPVEVITPKPAPPELIDQAPDIPRSTAKFILPDFKGFPDYDYKPTGKQITLVPSDRQLTILMGFPPEYPNVALRRGVEGYAIVGFSVSPAGEVVDPYIIESEPGTFFDRSALKAIKRFRYKAQLVNGKPVTTDGQRYMFRFELDK